MRSQSLALLGSPSSVAALLLLASAAPRISRMAGSDDGETVNFDLIPEAKLTSDDIEYKLNDDVEVPTTSIVIAIPGTEAYLVVENARMNEPAAKAIAATVAQLYANGNVIGTNHAEIYAPTPSLALDRISVRNRDGEKVNGVLLDDDSEIRVTATTAYSDGEKTNPVITLAAIGQAKVYALDPVTLQANVALELDSPIVRAARSALNDGSVALKLQDGTTAKINVNSDGKLTLAAIEAAPTDEVPTEAQGWQSIGLSLAIVDGDGAPTQAYVKPAADSVSYRFAPQAPAIEVESA